MKRLGMIVLMVTAGMAWAEALHEVIYVPIERFTAYTIEPPGVDLVLDLKPADGYEILWYDIRCQDWADCVQWIEDETRKNSYKLYVPSGNPAIPLMKKSSREWLAVTGGVRRVTGGGSGGPATVPLFEADVLSVNLDFVNDKLPDGSDHPDLADETREETIGAYVGLTGPLTPLIIRKIECQEIPEAVLNKLPVKLEQESNRQVKVWTNEARLGTQLTLPKVYKQEDLPIRVYVEPLEASEEERDLVFKVGCRFEKFADSAGTQKRWVEAVDRVKMTVLKMDIAMDGDRNPNHTIDFENPDDVKCLFWVNDDHDERYLLQTEQIWVEDDLGGSPDYNNDYIGFKSGPGSSCRRDLEDFTRLHILVDDFAANLSGITYWMNFENTTSGSPSVNIFEAINESMDYLENGTIADLQIQKTRLIMVGSTEVQLPSQYIKTGNLRSPFILEGMTAGKGDLTIIVKKDGNEVCKKAVTLELRPITKFYQVFQVATVGQDSTDVSASYNPDFTSSDDYLLFVHGFNVNAIDKAYWPGTVFKRLWWQGYKGHVGFFDWPCVLFSLDLHCYDDSEYNAWRCGAPLLDRINQLNNSIHSGKVRLFAHSQGNVVAGEALRLASGQVVHTYIGTQAAVPAGCYQTGIASYITATNTPDIFVEYPPTSAPYCAGVASKAGQLFSFYNNHDYALYGRNSFGTWEWNNAKRPDNSYHYTGPLNTYDTSAQPTPSRFYYDVVPYVPPAPRDMVFTNDTFEIFSYAAQAHGSALGVQPSMTDFSTFNLRSAPLNYNDAHYSHSRQFRSNIVDERAYWEEVFQDCGF